MAEVAGTFDAATAYHEAGHAVVAVLLGKAVHRVSVVPKWTWAGKCEFGPGQHKRAESWIEREVLVSLAGLAAEARHTGSYDRVGAARDLLFVRQTLRHRTTSRGWERLERRMLSKVEAMLADDVAWNAVTRIAEALLQHGTISGRMVQHLVAEAERGV